MTTIEKINRPFDPNEFMKQLTAIEDSANDSHLSIKKLCFILTMFSIERNNRVITGKTVRGTGYLPRGFISYWNWAKKNGYVKRVSYLEYILTPKAHKILLNVDSNYQRIGS